MDTHLSTPRIPDRSALRVLCLLTVAHGFPYIGNFLVLAIHIQYSSEKIQARLQAIFKRDNKLTS
jgi:hypothetical protein